MLKTFVLKAVAFAAISVAAGSAHAESNPFGFGSLKCAQYNAMIDENAAAEPMLFGWAQGFMAGLNARHLETGRPAADLLHEDMPLERQKLALRDSCLNNQDRSLGSGAITLYAALRAKQGLDIPKPTKQKR